MEKIYKLLTSGVYEDVKIGLHLLVASKEVDVIKFFKKYSKNRTNDPYVWDINIKYYTVLFNHYIEISRKYVICHFSDEDLRLRKKNTTGWGHDWTIITKENYLNGLY